MCPYHMYIFRWFSINIQQVPDPFEERTYLTRWKECATVVNEGFGAALARMYIDKYYDLKVSSEVSQPSYSSFLSSHETLFIYN